MVGTLIYVCSLFVFLLVFVVVEIFPEKLENFQFFRKNLANFSKALEKLINFSEMFPIFPENFPRLRTLIPTAIPYFRRQACGKM